ncbi:hypothetical protein ScPMuIL_010979 [Solemya velum]
MSDEEDDERGMPKRSNIWVRIHKRLTRRGVVDVDIDHHRYEMLGCIQTGIRDLMLNHPLLGPKDDLVPDDYQHVLESSIHTDSGKTFTFTSYASAVFATIRRSVDVDEEDYLNSIAPKDLPYLEFISNSKSGQDFFLSNNRQYLLKTDRRYCIDFFLSILGDYLQHFQTYPHSLIVKYLGLYSIKMPAERKKYFLVMQSIYYPSERIDERFDIKGCFAGRYQKPNPPGSDVITVLKDQNFAQDEVKIVLGSQKEWFVQQLKADVDFMKDIGVQDYSLLVGSHELHPEERRKSFSDVVLRVQKSLRPPSESPKKKVIFRKEDSVSVSSSTHKQTPEKLSGQQSDRSPKQESKGTDIQETGSTAQKEAAKEGNSEDRAKEQKGMDGECDLSEGKLLEELGKTEKLDHSDEIPTEQTETGVRKEAVTEYGKISTDIEEIVIEQEILDEETDLSNTLAAKQMETGEESALLEETSTEKNERHRELHQETGRHIKFTSTPDDDNVIVNVNGNSVRCEDISVIAPTNQSAGDESAECIEMKPFKRPPLQKQSSLLRSLTDVSYLDDNGIKNRRLLPNCKNALHIIDGEHHRYFVGLIDFFTLYEYRQRVGRIYKNVKYTCRDHSTLPPDEYGDRLFQFVADNTL